MIRFSFALAGTPTIAASTTFPDSVHPATNVLLPLRPHLRAYSANLSAQRLTLDLGAATSLAVIGLGHVNFATATIQGNATDAWGAPTYSQAITIGRSPNTRYQHNHRPTVAVPFNLRHVSLSIPNQATTDGAAVFRVGYLFAAGVIVSPPRNIQAAPDEENEEARADTETADGRRVQRLVFDDPTWHVIARRLAETEAEIAAWREIDRQWSGATGQAALVMMDDAFPEETWIMRQVSISKWQHKPFWSESEMELREVTAG